MLEKKNICTMCGNLEEVYNIVKIYNIVFPFVIFLTQSFGNL